MGKNALGQQVDQWGIPINTFYDSGTSGVVNTTPNNSVVQQPQINAPAVKTAMPTIGTQQPNSGLGSSFFKQTYADGKGGSYEGGGWGSAAVSAIGTGVNAYLGFKGLDLAEETLDFQKDSWERRFAMMQDQYYRKLNSRRANRVGGMESTNEENRRVADYYDSGTNLEGAYPGATQAPAASSGFAPTSENGRMMNLAQSGSPVSPAGARDMMTNPNSTITNVSGSGFAGGNPVRNQVPVTSADAAVSNTQIGPMGKPKKKKKKQDPERSGSNNAEQTS